MVKSRGISFRPWRGAGCGATQEEATASAPKELSLSVRCEKKGKAAANKQGRGATRSGNKSGVKQQQQGVSGAGASWHTPLCPPPRRPTAPPLPHGHPCRPAQAGRMPAAAPVGTAARRRPGRRRRGSRWQADGNAGRWAGRGGRQRTQAAPRAHPVQRRPAHAAIVEGVHVCAPGQQRRRQLQVPTLGGAVQQGGLVEGAAVGPRVALHVEEGFHCCSVAVLSSRPDGPAKRGAPRAAHSCRHARVSTTRGRPAGRQEMRRSTRSRAALCGLQGSGMLVSRHRAQRWSGRSGQLEVLGGGGGAAVP